MTPDPAPSNLERAQELEVAAKIARELGDYGFARECQQCADYLREHGEKLCTNSKTS